MSKPPFEANKASGVDAVSRSSVTRAPGGPRLSEAINSSITTRSPLRLVVDEGAVADSLHATADP
jgi:hypothetical protein